MGYTYNWNALQSGRTDPALGFDPFAPASFVGVSEFIVSAGSKIVNEGFVTNSQLGVWAVPGIVVVPEIDPSGLGSALALLAGVLGVCEWRLRRR